MNDGKEEGQAIIDAHQDMVRHIEASAGKIRLLSAVTVFVAAILTVSYLSQLLLPLTGTTTVTVNLADPGNVATEVAVLVLALLWLFVGLRDLRFSWRIAGEIRAARAKEKSIEERMS